MSTGLVNITVPRILAELMAGPQRPFERPNAETVDEAMRWLKRTYPDIPTDKPCRSWAKEILLLRYLVDTGRVSDGRP